MEREQRRVTSEDVARASGVSRATVSYVLNNDPRQSIPLETRERVLKVARDLGYRPFTAARILRVGYSRIVLVVPDPEAAGGERMKLLDFGLALFLDGQVRRTTTGTTRADSAPKNRS